MKNIFKKLFSWTRLAKPTEEEIIKEYLNVGQDFGDAVSYLAPMGKCEGFDNLFKRWKSLEIQYAGFGYSPISLDDFMLCGGYGDDISRYSYKKTEPDKPIIYHAEIYEMFFGDYKGGNLAETVISTGKATFATYPVISTDSELIQKMYIEIKSKNETRKD